MALKIRLARGGTKKRPYYRIVVADIRAPRDGRFIEKVGTYNPLLPKDSEDRVILKIDRIKYWISCGAKPSDRVHRFLDAADILKREPRENPQKAIPRAEAKQSKEAEPKAADAGEVDSEATESKETESKDVESKAPEAEASAPEVEAETKDAETKAPEAEAEAKEADTKAPEAEEATPEADAEAKEIETKE